MERFFQIRASLEVFYFSKRTSAPPGRGKPKGLERKARTPRSFREVENL